MKSIIRYLLICAALIGHSFVYADTINFKLIGLNNGSLSNAMARLKLERDSYGNELTTANIQSIYQQAPNEIRKAIEPYGYFHPIIHSTLRHDNNNWLATFTINPGKILRINKIDVSIDGEGKNNKKILAVIKRLPIKVGDAFQVENYEQAKSSLLQVANEQGYIKASFATKQILLDRRLNQAAIILHLSTGERYYFGGFTFNKNNYAEKFLRRFIPVTSQDAFSSEKLIQLQQDMGSSYYFKQVNITPDFNHIENNRIPVNIDSTLPKSQAYNFGLGYGTFTGPRLTAGVNFRRITDTGQHFDAQIKLSSVLSGLAAKYYIPGKNPLTDTWTIGLNWQRFMPKNGNSNSKSMSFGYLTKYKDLQISANLNYLLERYNIVDQSYVDSKLLYPNLNLSYTKTDDILNPKFGKAFSLNLQGASEPILSSTSFLQGEIKAKYLFSPTNYNSIFLRGDIGYTLVHDIQQLPLSMRFFAGGLNSIRGFPDSSIGPGRYLQTGSIEYRNKIYGNWNAAIFYDMGNATDHYGSQLNRSDGIGVIYNSMIGPIKLYVARAESKPDKPKSVEFSIGPEF